jgi:hypothetical protein
VKAEVKYFSVPFLNGNPVPQETRAVETLCSSCARLTNCPHADVLQGLDADHSIAVLVTECPLYQERR